MDPLTHALAGAALAQSVSRQTTLRLATVAGVLAGMAPDLDILIRSADDALLQLQYHRHFSHSLLFSVPAALLIAGPLYWIFRRKIGFARLFLMCLLAYAQGGLLDACTSYGTHLFWPFTNERESWGIIAIIDPLFTVPLGLLVLFTFFRRSRLSAWLAVLWCLSYLGWGHFQKNRAIEVLESVAESRGHRIERRDVKPSAFNNFLFRGLYEANGRYYVSAIRVGWFSDPVVYDGADVPAFPTETYLRSLAEGSRLHHDIVRFDFFSDHYLYKPEGSEPRLADLRYALLPNSIDPLWAIRYDPSKPDKGVEFETYREVDSDKLDTFKQMLKGQALNP